MSYAIKEMFYSLQGEGAQVGMPAVFLRFSGCNLWSGIDSERTVSPCQFCDTDFADTLGRYGGVYESAVELVNLARSLWPKGCKNPQLILTGGEPMLQVDEPLISAFKNHGFRLSIETNGTISVPDTIDWITVSPKPDTSLEQTRGNELKVVYPTGLDPKQYEKLQFEYFFLSPLWTANHQLNQRNMELARDYCLANPPWRMSNQCQRVWGVE